MTRQVRTSPGAAYDLGYHLVWCPKYRRPVLGGRLKGRLEGLIHARAAAHGRQMVALEVMPHPSNAPSFVAGRFKGFTSHHLRTGFAPLRSRLPTMWSRWYVVATVGVVSAQTVRRYIDRQYERTPKGQSHA
ncbi:IS200/IS605 family transposase [Sphaerisporangium sp. NPDC005289]|uniref:IS200/IS605 family transposase n=1 Tax=Sphaerisporangium sp. NPDC005289 TaxID=3155247 RepID=UPI0033BEF0AF